MFAAHLLIGTVCRTGGHLGANLGVVELTIAPHRDFGIPPRFLEHAKRGEVLADLGLTPAALAGRIGASLARMSGEGGGR